MWKYRLQAARAFILALLTADSYICANTCGNIAAIWVIKECPLVLSNAMVVIQNWIY
jgi:hypothetical protein